MIYSVADDLRTANSQGRAWKTAGFNTFHPSCFNFPSLLKFRCYSIFVLYCLQWHDGQKKTTSEVSTFLVKVFPSNYSFYHINASFLRQLSYAEYCWLIISCTNQSSFPLAVFNLSFLNNFYIKIRNCLLFWQFALAYVNRLLRIQYWTRGRKITC